MKIRSLVLVPLAAAALAGAVLVAGSNAGAASTTAGQVTMASPPNDTSTAGWEAGRST